MAQDIGTVYVQVAPSGKDFARSLEGDLTGSVDKAAKKSGVSLTGTLGNAFGKIGKIGLGAIGTITGGITALAAKGGFERALNIENAQAKLKGLGHDAGSVSQIMDNALTAVKSTAFGLGEAATVAASLSAAGVQSGQQMTKVLKTVADTAQISGRELTDIGTIFGSVAARGKLQGDDMLQLMSSGVPVLQMLAKHLNTTSEAVSDMVSSGKIDFQTFADAMQEGLGGAALAAGDTFTGALANVKAALSRLGEGPGSMALESLRRLFNAAIPAVDALTNQLTPLIEKLSGQLSPYVDKAVQLVERFSQGLQDGSITIQDIAGQIGSLAGAFALFAGVGGNIDTITGVFDALGGIGDGGFGKLAEGVKQLPAQLQSGLSGLQQFGTYFNKDLREALAVDGDPFANAINRIRQGAGKLTGPLGQLGSKIASTDLDKSVSGMAGSLSTGFGKLTSALDSNIRVLGARVGGGFTGIFSKLSDSGLVSGLSSMGGKAQAAISPMLSGLGDVFGGIGDIVGPKLQAGLDAVGSIIGRFFAPASFLKFLGIGALAAALVAGLGLLDQSMGGALPAMIDRFAAQAPAMIDGFVSRINAALPGLIASGTQIVTSLLDAVTTAAPSLIAGAGQIVATLVSGLGAAMPQIIPAALNMVMALLNAIIQQAPLLLQAGMQLLQGIVQGILVALPQLAAQIPVLVQSLMTALTTALPMLLQTGTQIITMLAQGLTTALPQLVAMLPQILNAIITGITTMLPQLVEQGVQLLLSLIDGLTSAIPQLAAQIPAVIAALVNTISSNLPQIIQAGVQIIIALAGGLVQAIPKVVAAIPEIVTNMWNAFTSVNWGEVGLNIITGIAAGIAGAAGQLVDAAMNAANDALKWVKDKLGIHSPSTVFRDQVGVMIGRGMAEGITRSQDVVNRSLGRMAGNLSLDGYTFSPPQMSLPMTAYAMTAGMQQQSQNLQSDLDERILDERILDELRAFHEDMPLILQSLGISIDGREFGRLTRKYAYATA